MYEGEFQNYLRHGKGQCEYRLEEEEKNYFYFKKGLDNSTPETGKKACGTARVFGSFKACNTKVSINRENAMGRAL